VQERRFYEQYGPVLDAHFVAAHDEWFSDVAHLNHAGALVLTDWLAPQLPALAGDPK
jgi:prephenate dehydrogenase